MTQDELAAKEYDVCHSGYISRDGLIPKEFFYMLKCFVTFLAISALFKVLMNYHWALGSFLYLLTAFSGICCLFAFAVNIEVKASSKRALRKRMTDIEEYFLKKRLDLEYWKSIVNRDKSWSEFIYKTKTAERIEKGSGTYFFVVASRVLVCAWIVLQISMYFGNIDLPQM